MSIEKKLEVKDLTISFRTNNGKVQAVRDISFDLHKGETLAIVGESGSGKSVTSRAILGISAANALIEGGEILYDGKDLLKIGEDDFHTIRGDRIAMVFQDPLSSLNPIMRIGKQLTEAMLLKNRASRRNCHRSYTATIKMLGSSIDAAGSADIGKGENAEYFKKFRAYIRRQASMEGPYDTAHENAIGGLAAAKDILLEIERNATGDIVTECNELRLYANGSFDRFVVSDDAEQLRSILDKLPALSRSAKSRKDCSSLVEPLASIRDILSNAISLEKPDFLALAYFETEVGTAPALPIDELNALTVEKLENGFMSDFKRRADGGVRYSFNRALEAKKAVIAAINEKLPVFQAQHLVHADINKAVSALYAAVEKSIDPLETVKDSLAYTFKVSLGSAIDSYFRGIVKNNAEQKRFSSQSKKYENLKKRGKKLDWQIAPLSLVDLELAKTNIVGMLTALSEHYKVQIKEAGKVDFNAKVDALILSLRSNAVGEVHRITRSMAKDQAIKLMDRVGIPEPRKRYKQYPFEFSGGMRQRIVIAISLTANPDILICDEPTTALDVTIQAQILELINELKKERQLSVIFITHDLGVVANMADRIAVMYAGKIVEYGTSEDVFYSPAHPYTWALLSSVPDLNTNDRLESIPGTPPNMIYPPVGDAFAARNKYAMEIDFEEQPPMFKISDTHYAATWLRHPSAPKVEPPKIVTERIARMTKAGGNANEQ